MNVARRVATYEWRAVMPQGRRAVCRDNREVMTGADAVCQTQGEGKKRCEWSGWRAICLEQWD